MPRAAVATKHTEAPEAPTIGRRGRKETHSTDFQIGQHSPITDKTERNDVSREKSNGHRMFGTRLKHQGDLTLLDGIEVDDAYLAELAFNEDWLKIIINPSTHKNAATIFENWSNGQGAEMLINGRAVVIRDLPVGKPITVKRKIVEQIIRARVTEVRTLYESTSVENPRNEILRTDSRVHSFTILDDPSPKRQEWLELCYARPL